MSKGPLIVTALPIAEVKDLDALVALLPDRMHGEELVTYILIIMERYLKAPDLRNQLLAALISREEIRNDQLSRESR